MLQLAAAACAKMAARRLGVVRPVLQRAIGAQQVAGRGPADKPPAGGDAIAFGGDAQDIIGLGHRQAA